MWCVASFRRVGAPPKLDTLLVRSRLARLLHTRLGSSVWIYLFQRHAGAYPNSIILVIQCLEQLRNGRSREKAHRTQCFCRGGANPKVSVLQRDDQCWDHPIRTLADSSQSI